VFTRDLVAAQADGLLTLTGLETPLELAGAVLEAPATADGQVIDAVGEARRLVGQFLAIDGPEYGLARRPAPAPDAAATYARELGIALRATGLGAVVNLNCATPPSWAADLAEGPLFAGRAEAAPAVPRDGLAEELLDHLARLPADGPEVRVDWHLGERDFRPGREGLLERLARRSLDGAPLAFVFDRPRRPVLLAEGLDRTHRALLATVGLHLPRLAELPGPVAAADAFLRRSGSLARLGLSAAAQKRDFLRRHGGQRPALTRGFLLDRARLAAVPVGLEAVSHRLAGRGLCGDGPGLEFARSVVQRLRQVLEQDGRTSHLEACLESAAAFTLASPGDPGRAAGAPDAAGLTAWDPGAPARAQVHAAGHLHAAAQAGTAAVLLAPGRPPSAAEVVDLLRHAWQRTDVARLRFLRAVPAPRQLVAPWEEAGVGAPGEPRP
jgi:hypothetical protein